MDQQFYNKNIYVNVQIRTGKMCSCPFSMQKNKHFLLGKNIKLLRSVFDIYLLNNIFKVYRFLQIETENVRHSLILR